MAVSQTKRDRHEVPRVPPAAATVDWRSVYRDMVRSRRIDRLEVEELTGSGKVALQFSAAGHELVQVLLAHALTHRHDAATVYYRSRPFVIASGLTVREALAGAMAKDGSPSEGRDVGVVLSLPRRGRAMVLPCAGDVGSQYSVAVGWAQSLVYYQDALADADRRGAIAVALGGDGSVATGGFWAALTAATTLRLPMLFFIEDNGYSISVPASLQTPGGNIARNLAAFGNLRVLDADGGDPLGAAAVIDDAIGRLRSGDGPCLLRFSVPRLFGHAFNDDQSYRSEAERRALPERDPLPRVRALFESEDPSVPAEIEREVEAELAAAQEAAESSAGPDPSTVQEHVVSAPRPRPAENAPLADGARMNMQATIRLTLANELRADPRVLMFGEDVGRKGGVHGVTRGLQTEAGECRVFDTSLSEDGIIGRAAGMAMAGLRPVPELQFRKYCDAAHEQITNLGTLRWRTAGRFAAPMVVRVPVGYGKRGGDPWHSVNGEAIFAHLIGWRIAFPSNAADAAGLLRTALCGDDPTLFLEHRVLLDAARARRPYPGDDYAIPFGVAATVVDGGELVAVTWGDMVHRCVEAAEAFPGRVAVLDLRTLSPWDAHTVLHQVRRCGKALIVHEDTVTAGFGAEIAATIASQAFAHLDAPVERVATPDCPTPYNHALMEAVLPTVARIRAAMQELLAY